MNFWGSVANSPFYVSLPSPLEHQQTPLQPSSPCASSTLKSSKIKKQKRGRKPKNWDDKTYVAQYLNTEDKKDFLRKNNNVYCGKYRKRKSDQMKQIKKDYRVEKLKRRPLMRIYEKNLKDIKMWRDLIFQK